MWLALASSLAHADTWPAGEPIEGAAAVHVTPAGLDSVAGLIPALIPTDPIAVGDQAASGGFGCFNYAYSLTNAKVYVNVVDAHLVPANGVLNAVIDLDVTLNDPFDKFNLYYELFCGGEDCPGYVTTFPVTVTVPFTLDVVNDQALGHRRLDATMGEIAVENGLVSNNIQLDCTIGTIETVLNYFGISLYDLIIGVVNDQIAGQLADQQAELEQTIEDALSASYVDQTVDVAGIPLHLTIEPDSATTTPDGLVILATTLAEAPSGGCVDAYDLGGSLRTDGAAPAIQDDPQNTGVALLASDDFADQALYALWRGGLLCYTIDANSDAVPIAVDTSLLGILGGDAFDRLWPENEPMVITTDPRNAPTVAWDGGHDITVQAEDMGLEVFTVLDGRPVHALGIRLDPNIGIDTSFDGTTGELGIEMGLDSNSLGASIGSNEFAPEADQQILDAFGGLVDSLLPSLIGPALEDLSFALPSSGGLGLTALGLDPAGDGSWLLANAGIGQVDYGADTGDTDTGAGGCGGGCASGGRGGSIAALALAVALVRRRWRA